MKKGVKAKPEEIIPTLRQVEIMINQGKTIALACRESGITEQTYYRWRKTYGGMQISQAKELKELRNSILNIGKIPEIVYQDNGKAFRAKFFTGDKDFEELGFVGVYGKLGIKPVFASPYNARAKVIERFFLEFQESLRNTNRLTLTLIHPVFQN